MERESKDVLKALAVVVVELAALALIFRVIARPDSLALARLRVLHTLEGFCDRNAQGYAHAAEFFNRAYDNARATV